VRIDVHTGDAEGLAQEVDVAKDDAYLHYCDGCGQKVLTMLTAWKPA